VGGQGGEAPLKLTTFHTLKSNFLMTFHALKSNFL
jgi:hypothetical protein